MTKIITNVEPFGSDVTLKYSCPNKECSNEHWISLKEAKIKNFKILCECCDTIFIPKRVKSLSVNFVENKKHDDPLPKPIKEEKKDFGFINVAVETLVLFGYDEKEAEYLITKAYNETKSTNPAALVKVVIEEIGVKK